MAVLLWCLRCGEEAVIIGEVPIVCPTCHAETTWTTAPPYRINLNDARFLKSIHVTQTN